MYTPEEIVTNLPSLTLEEVYATITYYLHHRARIDAYLTRLTAWRETRYQAWKAKPSSLIQRLQTYREQQRTPMVAT